MSEKTARGFCPLLRLAFLICLIAVALSSCTGYSQCLQNGGGAFRCTVSSRQINQAARAEISAACGGGDEMACQKGCGRMHDQEICDTWFAIKCPRNPSICQSACRLQHDQVACRGACEAGDEAACLDVTR
jgi:hypothetical protein